MTPLQSSHSFSPTPPASPVTSSPPPFPQAAFSGERLTSDEELLKLNETIEAKFIPFLKEQADHRPKEYLGSLRSILWSLLLTELYNEKDVEIICPQTWTHLAAGMCHRLPGKLSPSDSNTIAASLIRMGAESFEDAFEYILDPEMDAVETKIIEDAVTLERLGVLLSVEELTKLHLLPLHGEESTRPFVEEVKRFISLTEEESVKTSLKASPHPFEDLLRLLFQKNRGESEFPLLTRFITEAAKKSHLLQLAKSREVARSIFWIHGTSSAVLPFIEQTEMTFLPMGKLLDRGIAPMCGELFLGGMSWSGINQSGISVVLGERLEIAAPYACGYKASSENPTEVPLEKWIESLLERGKGGIAGDSFDTTLIRLLRFKQSYRDDFLERIRPFSERIQEWIDEARDAPPYCVQKSMIELLAMSQAEINEVFQDEEAFRKKFPDLPKKADLPKTQQGISSPHITTEADAIRNSWDLSMTILQHKLYGSIDRWNKDFRSQCGPFETYDDLLNLTLGRGVERAYKRRIALHEARIGRLESLFSEKSGITVSDERDPPPPFPLSIASTHFPCWSGSIHSIEKKLDKATLGEEIDLCFVPRENKGEMRAWLQTHGAGKNVRVLDIQHMKNALSLRFASPSTAFVLRSQLTEPKSIFQANVWSKRHREKISMHTDITRAVRAQLWALLLAEVTSEKCVLQVGIAPLMLSAALAAADLREVLLQEGVEADTIDYLVACAENRIRLDDPTPEAILLHDVSLCDAFEAEEAESSPPPFKLAIDPTFVEDMCAFTKFTEQPEIKGLIEESQAPLTTLFSLLLREGEAFPHIHRYIADGVMRSGVLRQESQVA